MAGTPRRASPKKRAAAKKNAKRPAPSPSATVDVVFKSYPGPTRPKLLALRRLILDTARTTEGVGRIEEALKWGQPSYLTPETGSGSTVRIDHVAGNQYAIFFHCQTDLVATFREIYPGKWSFGGNRCIYLDAEDKLDEAALRHCIALALTYHLRRKSASKARRA